MKTLRPYQSRAVALTLAALSRNPILVAPTGAGKCLGKDTPVLLFDGTVKRVQEVSIGDLLMGPDSKPRKVTTICTGQETLYKIVPTKGDSYVVNESHVLSLKRTRQKLNPRYKREHIAGDVVNIPVSDFVSTSKWFKHIHKGWRSGVDFALHTEPARIDPYFLGVWLGDGNSRTGAVTTGDVEIVEFLQLHAKKLGLRFSRKQNSNNSENISLLNRTWRTERGVKGQFAGGPIMNALRYYGLIKNKHIPHRFKTGTRDERFSVLAGVLDTDGCFSNGGYDLTLKSERLFDDVVFIARSLGFSAYKTSVRKTCTNNGVEGSYWRCNINGPVEQIPCRINRKKAPKRKQKKNPLITAIKAVPIGSGDYYGFEIEGPDHLFLLGDFTVTHNTVMGCAIAAQFAGDGKRVLWIAHRKELIEQAAATLEPYLSFPPGIIMASYGESPMSAVQVASVQTLARRTVPAADLVVVDEAHHATSESYACVKEFPRIGLTATPFRLDGRGLGDVFGEIVVAAYTDELCASGVLHAPKVYAGQAPDLRGVKKSMGDYVTSALSERLDKTELVGDIVETWKALAAGKRTVVFAVDVAHSQHIAAQFREAGVRAEHIDGTTPKAEREATLARLRAGATQVVCNCMILTEGWDLPALEVAVIARPTASLNLHLQMLGRIMRAADGKDGCIVLDHAGNHFTHGLVTRRIGYSMNGKIVGEKDPLGLRRCGACQLLFDPKLDQCPDCGWVPEKQTREVAHGSGALHEFSDDFVFRRAMYRIWVAQAEDSGFAPGWVAYRYKERFDEWPVTAFGDLVDPNNASMDEKREVFRALSETAQVKGFKPGWAAHKYRDFFGVWPSGFVCEVRESLGVSSAAVERGNRLLAGVGVATGSSTGDDEWLF